jgi:pimeloyl-ACP methyl ester carboxylesterase
MESTVAALSRQSAQAALSPLPPLSAQPAESTVSRRLRVIAYSLDESAGVAAAEPLLDRLSEQLERVLDQHQLGKAVICGVSFGGIVAIRFAARHPERTAALVLASAPGPGWHLREEHRACLRRPRLAAPLFLATMPARLWREIAAALPSWRARSRLAFRMLRTLARAPIAPASMAARARLIDPVDNTADCARVTAPTLVITGEPSLDYVVPADTTGTYATLIPGARRVTIERTGHLGFITRPDAFAAAVTAFLDAAGLLPDVPQHLPEHAA